MPLVTNDPLPAPPETRTKLAEWLFQHDHLGYQMVGSFCFIYKLPTMRLFRALERAEAQDAVEAGYQFLNAIRLTELPRLKPSGLSGLLRTIIDEHYPFEAKMLTDVDMASNGRATTLLGIIDAHLSALGTDKQVWDLNYEQIIDLLGKKVMLTGQPLVPKRRMRHGDSTRKGRNDSGDVGPGDREAAPSNQVEAGSRRSAAGLDRTDAGGHRGNETPQADPRTQPEADGGVRSGREARRPQAGPGSTIRGS
jgi:hypothetical protein